ncbi:ABC transporter ATP-binding protein [Clostridium botulinum]|uniref:Sodium ABC transporter ATP-binding protein n=1 Tax=Clostridium botulinum TaxID=1491 RepID=A0A9Q1UW32_CLOBO|nr:ABC transporter ATP-binding protein [Clostridium botulinum]AEB76447.1 ABC transporter, ATP-binding protein [Clostridium botulinum BKT015925]KEI01046.1 sodium ABC transporter ATP-binding protein [Clostridium botulinum D str. 16868]KEI04773.1 sodium ABC transporter ATP-binding protein [Clostridium botulinum C/D str. Sp77]KLU75988.1 sodium ABC transporter ATP-binding protein [Clostridium botulinum V891]KOA74889.1 sodium ABC transporter ATP-binding protein [Clostridium botulinum]
MEKILEVKNLCKEYKKFAIDDISFNLERGYIMGFIGPNGAGKSTTIKLIMNLIKKTSGEINIFGLNNEKHEKDIKDRIGFVYDESHFYEDLTIKSMKNIIAPFYSKWNEKKFNKYLRDFDLDPKKKIKELSKGMKTKFYLAIALSHEAELIIMDEPTAGLDPIFRREILDILSDIIQDDSKSIFFSTHITTDLDRIADYVTFINKGKIEFSKSKDDVIENYALIRGGCELINEETKKYFVGLSKNSFGFEGIAKDRREIKRVFQDKCIIERPTLEDIMLYTVRGDKNV